MIVALVATVGASSVAQVSRLTADDAKNNDKLGISVCKLTASDGEAHDYFGWGVAVFEGTIVVGSPGHDNVATDDGAVYVFRDCVQVAKLVANDGANQDYMGESVGISRANIVAGAKWARIDNENQAGAAYVFSATTPTYAQVAKLVASDGGNNDDFGQSVTVYDDAIVVGAKGYAHTGTDKGAAYLFRILPDPTSAPSIAPQTTTAHPAPAALSSPSPSGLPTTPPYVVAVALADIPSHSLTNFRALAATVNVAIGVAHDLPHNLTNFRALAATVVVAIGFAHYSPRNHTNFRAHVATVNVAVGLSQRGSNDLSVGI
ncbi:hypothetical protein CTAYLR_007047 [Chrysophaeum taylorii]|uniref:Uncharacterized protein n=1 Tax=Chrysophaeum taylorii TaxID=2483200 RepID=A0AAD7XPZ6_9STRA|nr:hypothetical protein CTAYLR_007047 [Chrysophaeum taylorii]